jgi:hypothetical protein
VAVETRFETFARSALAAPGYDNIAQPFDESYEQFRRMGLSIQMRVTLAVFRNLPNPHLLPTEELKWTVYMFEPEHGVKSVAEMNRENLAAEYARLTLLKPWPEIRKSIAWTQMDDAGDGDREISMPIIEIDVAHRSLRALCVMCEIKYEDTFSSTRHQRAAIAQDAARSLIVRLSDGPGGVPDPGGRSSRLCGSCILCGS